MMLISSCQNVFIRRSAFPLYEQQSCLAIFRGTKFSGVFFTLNINVMFFLRNGTDS